MSKNCPSYTFWVLPSPSYICRSPTVTLSFCVLETPQYSSKQRSRRSRDFKTGGGGGWHCGDSGIAFAEYGNLEDAKRLRTSIVPSPWRYRRTKFGWGQLSLCSPLEPLIITRVVPVELYKKFTVNGDYDDILLRLQLPVLQPPTSHNLCKFTFITEFTRNTKSSPGMVGAAAPCPVCFPV